MSTPALATPGIHEWQAYTQDATLRTQVCIVGSGCGGATLAKQLAAAGVDVIVVEQGAYVPSTRMDQDELNMTGKLYGARGMATDSSFSANLLYGNNVGGASVHYWADSYRTPSEKLQQWREQYGMQGHDAADLAPAFDEIEATLCRLLKENNHLTLVECRDRLAEETGVRVNPWTIGRALRRLDWT